MVWMYHKRAIQETRKYFSEEQYEAPFKFTFDGDAVPALSITVDNTALYF